MVPYHQGSMHIERFISLDIIFSCTTAPPLCWQERVLLLISQTKPGELRSQLRLYNGCSKPFSSVWAINPQQQHKLSCPATDTQTILDHTFCFWPYLILVYLLQNLITPPVAAGGRPPDALNSSFARNRPQAGSLVLKSFAKVQQLVFTHICIYLAPSCPLFPSPL